MKKLRRIVVVCGCIGALLSPFCATEAPAVEGTGQDAKEASSGIRKFKSSSRMKDRDKSKSRFGKRKHFGRKKQAQPPAPPKQ